MFRSRPHPAPKRLLVALTAVALLLVGFGVYVTDRAPSASASPRSAIVTGGLSVSVMPSSVTVGVGTVSATILYTCTDTAAPGGNAALRVEFDQHGNDASAEVAVPCGIANVNKTQTVTATQVGMSGTQEITVVAGLTDGPVTAVDTADTVTGGIYVHLDPSATFPGNGTVTRTGYYNCATGTPTPTSAIINLDQVQAGNLAAAGEGVVTVLTCNGANQTFNINITSCTGNGFTAGTPLASQAVIPTIGGGGSFTGRSTIDYSLLIG
ncbi:hypothetical protein ACFYS8_19845 [Kitasatospora sp. NPDC004615]|uniref:hypothetical protein n=1 Tax=Kitasatospora sp. NPDC004615 TaxID=3364017 RepID=UPI0036C76346